MRKAQLMIEYMVILVIMLLLFNSISLDLVNTSTEDASFLQIAETINVSKMVVSDSAKIISLQGSGAKKIIKLRAPPDCDYVLSLNVIAVECDPISRFYDNFTGQSITQSAITGITYSINGGIIRSGDLGSVTVSKT
jgi:hypothetical protein